MRRGLSPRALSTSGAACSFAGAGGRPPCRRMGDRSLGLHPLAAGRRPQDPRCNNQKCLQTWPSVPGRARGPKSHVFLTRARTRTHSHTRTPFCGWFWADQLALWPESASCYTLTPLETHFPVRGRQPSNRRPSLSGGRLEERARGWKPVSAVLAEDPLGAGQGRRDKTRLPTSHGAALRGESSQLNAQRHDLR